MGIRFVHMIIIIAQGRGHQDENGDRKGESGTN